MYHSWGRKFFHIASSPYTVLTSGGDCASISKFCSVFIACLLSGVQRLSTIRELLMYGSEGKYIQVGYITNSIASVIWEMRVSVNKDSTVNTHT